MNALSESVRTGKPKLRLALGGFILSVALGGLGYVFATYRASGPATADHKAPAPTVCDLRQGACTAMFPGGESLRLDIEPKSIPPMQPLRVAVEISGFEAEHLKVAFSGVTMNMGLNRSQLLDVGDHRFAGDAILPICVRRSMDWEAKVTASGPQGIWETSFFFATHQP